MLNKLNKLKNYLKLKNLNKEAKLVSNIISDLKSHSLQPEIGEIVENTNPGCKHFGSKGKVLDVKNLDDDKGITVVYIVSNSNGDSYNSGDILEKTLDQLSILR